MDRIGELERTRDETPGSSQGGARRRRMRAVSALIPCLLVGACTSHPPRSGPLASNDGRRDLVGTWSVELIADTVDSFVRDDRYPRFVGRHGVPATTTTGTLHLLDSLDVESMYARLDSDILNVLCFKGYTSHLVRIVLRRTGDHIELAIPPYFAMGPAYQTNLSVTARYYGDSIVGRWGEQCSLAVATSGRLRMIRTGGT